MRKLILALLAGLVAGAASMVWLSPGAATEGDGWIPPPGTIVEIEGNKLNGFGIYYYDGSSNFPPTDSEAMAECSEYDLRVDRVRCRTEVRIWYRDLGATKRALRLARME